MGAVNPARGDFFSLVVPHCDHVVFQAFLDELAKHTARTEPRTSASLSLSIMPPGTSMHR